MFTAMMALVGVMLASMESESRQKVFASMPANTGMAFQCRMAVALAHIDHGRAAKIDAAVIDTQRPKERNVGASTKSDLQHFCIRRKWFRIAVLCN